MTDSSGCSATSTPLVINNVGIAEIKNNYSVSISPNPFSTSATIVIATPSIRGKQSLENIQIVIYDVLGRKQQIASQKLAMIASGKAEIKIDRGNLREGMYFYRLTLNPSPEGEGLQKEVIGAGKLLIIK